MKIVRRVFVVLLADDRHGKSTMIRAFVSQGLGKPVQLQKKGIRLLTSPWGRPVDGYIFGRSYQEREKRQHKSVESSLDTNDSDWRNRELVIMPSHVGGIKNKGDADDIDQMIDAAHAAGFDVICATVIFTGDEEDDRAQFADIWRKPWDEIYLTNR